MMTYLLFMYLIITYLSNILTNVNLNWENKYVFTNII